MANLLVDFTSGIVSGIACCFSGFFLDTVKVRMQTQMYSSSAKMSAGEVQFQGSLATLKQIVNKQGFLSLFRGIYYPIIWLPKMSSVEFTSYECYKAARNKKELSFWDGVQNGAFAGFCVAFVTTPSDLVKCIMQSDAHRYLNSRACMKHTIKQQGYKALFRGNFAMIMRDVPGFAAQFSLYEHLKSYFVSPTHQHLTLLESIIVCPLPAMANWIVSYPADVIKTTIQTHSANSFKKHSFLPDGGFFDCAKQIYNKHGIQGFMIGLGPCLLRALYSDSIGIIAYQKSREFLWEFRTAQ